MVFWWINRSDYILQLELACHGESFLAVISIVWHCINIANTQNLVSTFWHTTTAATTTTTDNSNNNNNNNINCKLCSAQEQVTTNNQDKRATSKPPAAPQASATTTAATTTTSITATGKQQINVQQENDPQLTTNNYSQKRNGNYESSPTTIKTQSTTIYWCNCFCSLMHLTVGTYGQQFTSLGT